MKGRFSLSRFLHNDKLMMLISLLLAILIWALVVFGPSNTEEYVISGVPISVTLNDYATETLKLRISDGAEATATVKVRGLRSVVSRLTAADIMITADTGNVIKEGTYTLPLRVVSNGDYTIQSIVGPDGSNDTVTISCDAWREAWYAVSVETPHLSVSDEKVYQMGTAVVNDTVLRDGMISVSGPRSDIMRIDKVVAVVKDKETISEAGVFTAELEARDLDGKVINSITFGKVENGKVSVTVPVLVYREVLLQPEVLNIPEGYKDTADLVTVTPNKLELWGVPSEIDEYINSIKQQFKMDFNYLTPDALVKEIVLTPQEGIRPVNGTETIVVQVNLNNITQRTFDVALDEKNFIAENVPAGMTVLPKQTKLTVTLCGPSRAIQAMKAQDLRVYVDLSTVSTGLQTVHAKVSVANYDTVWACYDANQVGIELVLMMGKQAPLTE